LIELPPAEIKCILNLGIYNNIPENIADIVNEICQRFHSPTILVGNEGSRVIYVKDYSGNITTKDFVSFMETLAGKYNADEYTFRGDIPLTYRLWWD
jgi:hypothetical protein